MTHIGRSIPPAARLALLAAFLAVANAPAWAKDADLILGGPGNGSGKFGQVRDMVFGPDNCLYVLDGGDFRFRDKDHKGNLLVQKFDAGGKFVSQFSVYDGELGDRNDPMRLAVDSKGNVYVTQPAAGVVQQFAPDGKALNKFSVPGAFAVAVQKAGGRERVLVAAQPAPGGRGPIDQLEVINPAGLVGAPLKLGQKLTRCEALTCDAQGNLYALAETQQIYKFDPAGRPLLTIGAGTRLRMSDGSELQHAVAVDAKGNIHSISGGWIVRFDAPFTTVTRREGRFQWFDPWSGNNSYTPLAVDRDGRLWLVATGYDDGKARHHFRPAVVRTAADYFAGQAQSASAVLLGLNLEVQCRLPYSIAYDLSPATFDFIVKPGTRRVKAVNVAWRAYDVNGQAAGEGRFDLALEDGKEARREVQFTPPRWGWYTLEFNVSSGSVPLTAVGAHLGVTPKYPGLAELKAGESDGSWEDVARQVFVGLPLMRVHPRPGQLDNLEKIVQKAAKHGATLLAQFTGKNEATAEFVREAVTRFKGRIRYWEIINEPNFSFKPGDYVELCRRLYAIIKEVDPAAKVLAPAVCGLQLPWYKAFYEAGGGKCCDILSLHDYEGHESIDPFHWRRKFADLRKLMAEHGDADKPIWQTERGIPGVRADIFLGPAQAVRVLLHCNLLSALGVPNEHSIYYYLNQGGYGAYPAYLWSHVGPHPAAVALRTRAAMLVGRSLAGPVDLGPTGNKLYLALRYTGDEGETLVLQNLGTLDGPLDLAVAGGGGALKVVDAFGNASEVPVRGGTARVTVGAMPIYVLPGKGRSVQPPKIDFGPNLAPQAKFAFSGKLKSDDTSVLANGVFESPHAGYPTQYKYLEAAIAEFPQYLDITFPQPVTIGRMVVYSIRADNLQSALLDYDIQHHDGSAWVTDCEVRTPMRPSSAVITPACRANTWYMDTNFLVGELKPAAAARWRLAIRRTTHGLLPDAEAERITGKNFGPRLHLREIEIHAPASQR